MTFTQSCNTPFAGKHSTLIHLFSFVPKYKLFAMRNNNLLCFMPISTFFSKHLTLSGLAADGAKMAIFRLCSLGYRCVAFVHDEVGGVANYYYWPPDPPFTLQILIEVPTGGVGNDGTDVALNGTLAERSLQGHMEFIERVMQEAMMVGVDTVYSLHPRNWC